jgi:two-component system nitrogen regulation response regulator GlnG
LTLLAHPDVSRVGEIAVLFSAAAGGARKLNRLEPSFALRGGEGRPLASAVLSRSPLSIRTTRAGSVELVPSEGCKAKLAREPLDHPTTVDTEALTDGVVLELAECVLLLLHRLDAKPRSEPDRGLVGESLAIRSVRAEIQKLADLETCVLIRGESGSGKELVARAIHDLSRRKTHAYVAVNVGAIPSAMAASALFGHARGAFTGAVQRHPGFFGSAENGTLFLDEIGEAPKQIQALLLRAVREHEIQPVGEAEPRHANVRLLTATDADLERRTEDGEFSAPLLRRLEAYCVRVPPLRERKDDIPRLFVRFLREELEQTDELDKLAEPPAAKKPWLPSAFIAALVRYPWPGNVAELQTVARRLAICNRGAKHFTLDAWLEQRLSLEAGRSDGKRASGRPLSAEKRDPRGISDAEIVAAMREARFKVVKAGEILGVSRSWLNTRLEFCEGLRKAKELTAEEIETAASKASGNTRVTAELLEVSEHGLKLRMNALGLGS